MTGMPSWESAESGEASSIQPCSLAQLLVGHGQLHSDFCVQPLVSAVSSWLAGNVCWLVALLPVG